ncbi:BQ2448_327 [Microbotryum intermedium]|uniref:BQ2448_327 protein n=1 Tax=Microbotryum intermedium TaxID=269621 RepID=A0A238FAU7_9BASI|nr:BQ2448_327 [Microbotryum intermedium]
MRTMQDHSEPATIQDQHSDDLSDLTSLDSSDGDDDDDVLSTPSWPDRYDRRLSLRCRTGTAVHSNIILETLPTSPCEEPSTSSVADRRGRRGLAPAAKGGPSGAPPPPRGKRKWHQRKQSRRIKSKQQTQQVHQVEPSSIWIERNRTSPRENVEFHNKARLRSESLPAIQIRTPPSLSLCLERPLYSPSLVALHSPRPRSETFATDAPSCGSPDPCSPILTCPSYDLGDLLDHVEDSETEFDRKHDEVVVQLAVPRTPSSLSDPDTASPILEHASLELSQEHVHGSVHSYEACPQHTTNEAASKMEASGAAPQAEAQGLPAKEQVRIDPTPSSSAAATLRSLAVTHAYHDLSNDAVTIRAISDPSSITTTPSNSPPPLLPLPIPAIAAISDTSFLDALLSLSQSPEPDTRKAFSIDKSEWVEPEKDLKISDEGYPPIWCQSRQELCEALPYFRAYQGGHYDLGERCIGYLLDGFPAPGDRCEAKGKIIISHGGGCSEGDGNEFRLIRDQTRDNIRVRALINCHNTQTPVVLLAGKNYAHFPWLESRDIRYCVLGYYMVRDFWVEAEPNRATSGTGFFTRFKFLFEWVSSQGQPWFDQLIGPMDVEHLGISTTSLLDAASDEGAERWCSACQRWTPDVFEEMIACLDERCEAFFKIPVQGLALSETLRSCLSDLSYRSSLLQPRPRPSDQSTLHVPLSIYPPALQDLSSSLVDYSRSSWRGFWCRQCGRLSSRSQWFFLVCSNPCCTEKITLERRLFNADELRSRKPRKEPSVSDPAWLDWIDTNEDWQGWSIDLGEETRILQLWPRTGSPEEGLADALLEQYQSRAVGELLKRNMLTSHKVSGGFLTSQFSFNAGQSYNHVVSVETYPFSDHPTQPDRPNDEQPTRAPPCVTTARDHLQSAVQSLCSDSSTTQPGGFNEVLSVAYYQGGKMSYHDDGEQGVGPIVASLSLGADATMSFRRKSKGASNSTLNSKDGEDGVKGGGAGARKSKAVVQLQLRHGDVMIMHGSGVQKNLDHMVEPVNLRFAATARFIHPSNGSTKTGRKKRMITADAITTPSVVGPPTPTSLASASMPRSFLAVVPPLFDTPIPLVDQACFLRANYFNLPPLPPSFSPSSMYELKPSYRLAGEHPQTFDLPPQVTSVYEPP